MWSYFVEWLIMRVLVRWFPSRYRLIPRRSDGAPLLRQFKIFGGSNTKHGCYLQSFVNAEERDLFHVHRWRRMISIVLSGWFVEERYPGLPPVCSHRRSSSVAFKFLRLHKRLSIYFMDNTVIHRLHGVGPRTWTLFFMIGNENDWGYFERPEEVRYRAWDRAIKKERRVSAL